MSYEKKYGKEWLKNHDNNPDKEDVQDINQHEHDWQEQHREESDDVIIIYYGCSICYKQKTKNYICEDE